VETLDKPQSQASGIQEVTEEEANAIEVQAEDAEFEIADDEARAREEVEDQIRECTKACWGNLAACYLATVRSFRGYRFQLTIQEENKEAVDACTKGQINPVHPLHTLMFSSCYRSALYQSSSATSLRQRAYQHMVLAHFRPRW